MPRVKADKALIANTKPKTIKKKSPTHSLAKKKVKPVVVEVIEDELIDPAGQEEFLSAFTAAEKVAEKTKISRSQDEEPLIREVEDDSEDIDQQKRFFSELAAKHQQPKNQGASNLNQDEDRPHKSLNLYRRLVWKFIVLVLILAGIVTYFSFSKLTIVVAPKGETLNDTLFLKVASSADLLASTTASTTDIVDNEQADPREEISGSIQEISANVEKTYPVSGEEFGGEDIVGQVKMINNSNKAQALVATTRLLSPDNKLFRIKNAVNIPAGGEVMVDIYTDKPSADLAINPTTFTIPGLWLGLQDKIFARSDQAFVFKQKIKKYIKASDIEAATKDINDLLLKNAQNQLNSRGDDWLYDSSSAASLVIDGRADEFKESFNIKASGTVIAVSFDKKQAAKLAAAKLKLLVPDDKELVDFDASKIIYALDSYDVKSGVATIKASFNADMILKEDSEIIDRKQLVNLNKSQIDTYLEGFPEIKSYELHFFPGFIKKAPNLVDRINIKINK